MNATLNMSACISPDGHFDEAARVLGQPVRVALLQTSDAVFIDWPDDERVIATTRAKTQQENWYRSRAALQRLLSKNRRAAYQCFPALDVSISHTGEWAAALYMKNALGCGIDIELPRPVSPGIARHILGSVEQAALLPTRDLLTVWTIKEALFKADMNNADKLLHHYLLENINADSGVALRHDGKVAMRYWSSSLVNGLYIAIACAIADLPDPQTFTMEIK